MYYFIGTTVLGAFDPIPEIADICSKYKIWLHVDAAWGGGALVSKKHRHLLEGIERYVLIHLVLNPRLQQITFFMFLE
jgi:glutamate/tyrosine decarboxylase-like PLP-dependent enzyme